VTVVLGGNHTTTMGNALTTLGYGYTLASGTMIPNPATYNLGKGDVVIISNDGGTPENVDYANFLNAGGHVIAVGGSSLTSFHTWVSTYFKITDHNSGWHTDGAWTITTAGQSKFPAYPRATRSRTTSRRTT
jgi:DNA-binding MurR/RpiR family transcriptional regulator